MNLKYLKDGHSLFMFDRNSMEFYHGKVLRDVTQPYFDNNYKITSKVFDVEVEYNGMTKVFSFPENIGYVGYTPTNILISSTREPVVAEMESLKNTFEKDIDEDTIAFKKRAIEKFKTALADLDPSYKRNQDQENRLSKLESNLDTISKTVSGFAEVLNRIDKRVKNLKDDE